MTRPLACAVAGLVLYIVVVALRFLAINVWIEGHASWLLEFPGLLNENGYWELSVVVLLFVLLLPPLKLLLLVLVLTGLRLPAPPAVLRRMFRWYGWVSPWAMIEVFLIGVMVAYSRLVDLANISIGPAVWALAGLMMATLAVDISLDPEAVWSAIESRTKGSQTGRVDGEEIAEPLTDQIGCPRCGKVCKSSPEGALKCSRCGGTVWPRKPASLSRAWALLAAAAICCGFAYGLPVMTVTHLGRGTSTTIFAGMIELAAIGWWPIAIVVFIASIAIPMFKLVALGLMLISVHSGATGGLRSRTRIYRFVELIGRWSMIDVFMVSILTVLVQLGFIASVRPEAGVIAFGGVVILTMAAAFSFDPRLMWDAATRDSVAVQSEPRLVT